MYCPKCGTQNPDAAKFCSNCGSLQNIPGQPSGQPRTPWQTASQHTPPQTPPPYQTGPLPPGPIADYRTSNIALIALSIITCCCTSLTAPVTLILGIIGLTNANAANNAAAAGNLDAAATHAKTAKTLFHIGIILLALSFAANLIFGLTKTIIQQLPPEIRHELRRVAR